MNDSSMSVWTLENTKMLFDKAYAALSADRPLSGVYREVASLLGISEGSVRNHYYAHLHTFSLLPETRDRLGIRVINRGRVYSKFAPGESERMIKEVLCARAAGESVRAAVTRLAHGDAKVALRLQNKFRSVMYGQPARAGKILDELALEGKPYYDPLRREIRAPVDTSSPESRLRAAVQLVGADNLARVLELIGASSETNTEALRAFVAAHGAAAKGAPATTP